MIFLANGSMEILREPNSSCNATSASKRAPIHENLSSRSMRKPRRFVRDGCKIIKGFGNFNVKIDLIL